MISYYRLYVIIIIISFLLFQIKYLLFDSNKKEVSLKEKLEVMCEHTELFERELGGLKNFAIMKKHYKAYVNGFDGAKELRVKLMEDATTAKEVREIVENFLAGYRNLL